VGQLGILKIAEPNNGVAAAASPGERGLIESGGFPMNRRQLLNAASAIPLLPSAELWQLAAAWADDGQAKPAFSRVRPADAAWPSEESWNKLGRAVEGRLIKVNSPLSACRESPDSPACAEVFKGQCLRQQGVRPVMDRTSNNNFGSQSSAIR
jgi:hypothetical protein